MNSAFMVVSDLLRTVMILGCLLFATSTQILAAESDTPPLRLADSVLVIKNERRLYLLADGEVFAEYPATFGGNPKGHKQREGDQRTPEGHYMLDWKNQHSAYYKSIHVDYPNPEDRAAAAARGEDPGGQIMIHGQRNGYGWLAPLARFFNWTDGCIALSDSDMEEVWRSVPENTPIEIRP
jgi:murein L,D-transpeptidase YafK